MRSMKFSAYPVMNSFAADPALAGYVPGGGFYNSIAAKYGYDVANQVATAAANDDRASMSMILGSAVPLGQPGGGSVLPSLDESTTDIFVSQMYNDPLGAPLEQVNRILTNTGKHIAASTGITATLTLLGVGALAWFVLAHNK